MGVTCVVAAAIRKRLETTDDATTSALGIKVACLHRDGLDVWRVTTLISPHCSARICHQHCLPSSHHFASHNCNANAGKYLDLIPLFLKFDRTSTQKKLDNRTRIR